MFVPLRILMVLLLAAALHFFYHLREKSLRDKIFGSVLLFYLIHVSFIFPLLLVGIYEYGYIDKAAPFSLSYGPVLYFLYRATISKTLSMKNIIKHSLPVLMFWVIYFVFVFDGAFRERVKIWYYPVVYGSIGLSLILYSGYVIFSGRKFRIMVSKINYFAWYCILSGIFMLYLTYIFITTGVHVHEKRTPESSAVTVAVFMCLGVLILLTESFNKFRAQYFPSLRKHTTPKVKQEAPKENASIPQPAQAQVREDENFYALEEYFSSERICDPSLTIKDTATSLNITQKTLNERIALYYNTTFAKLLVSKRVDMACKVLRSNDFKNEFDKLAAECGFGSKATFYRNFQQLRGCTPSQFRSKSLNEKSL